MELAILFSVISLIIAGISLLFSFMKFGINITQEFCERPDILERKEKLETAYIDKLNEEWRNLIDKYPEKRKFEEHALEDLFNFGLSAFICSLPTIIINDISSFTKAMISCLAVIMISISCGAFSYWLYYQAIIIIPTVQKNMICILLLLFSLAVGLSTAKDMKNMIPKIIELRQKFFILSENMGLGEVKDLWNELREKNLL